MDGDDDGAGLMAGILPLAVCAVETHADVAGVELGPEERVISAAAIPARRNEFATGRHCARRALAQLGVTPAPIGRGSAGEPRWPPGVVGSITHCAGYRAAAVARTTDVLGLGIDAEPRSPLPPGVLPLVASPGEQQHLATLGRVDPDTPWDTVLFTAKEAVYKTWFPLARRWLGFHDAEVTIDPHGACFTARLMQPSSPWADGYPVDELHGRFLTRSGLVAATVVLARDVR